MTVVSVAFAIVLMVVLCCRDCVVELLGIIMDVDVNVDDNSPSEIEETVGGSTGSVVKTVCIKVVFPKKLSVSKIDAVVASVNKRLDRVVVSFLTSLKSVASIVG